MTTRSGFSRTICVYRLWVPVLLLCGVLGAGCTQHLHDRPLSDDPLPGPEYVIDREITDLVYTPPNWPQALYADLYLPRKSGLSAVVIAVHGGSWSGRSREDMTAISRELATHGYAVLNLDYRFAPRYTFPAQLHDLQQALAWLGENASSYQLDMQRISVWGYSSGAHLAALLAANPSIPGSNREPPSKRLIRAVVAGGIPADLRPYGDSPILQRFLGGSGAEMPDRYAEASPIYHVSAGDPPVFLYHGQLDILVGAQQSRNYYDALVAAGVDAELYLHRLRGHGTMFKFASEAQRSAIAFLDRHNESD
jgi:acetyl esterase/lipase